MDGLSRCGLSLSSRLWVGGFYSDEIVQRPTMVSGNSNSTSLALLAKVDPLDYYSQRGFGLTLSTKLVDFTQLRVQYNDFDQSSVAVVFDFALLDNDKLQRDNPSIVDGRLRSLSASLTYDSRPLLKRKGRDFRFNTLIYTRITLTAEYASPSFVTNDFDFRRYAVRLHREQRTLNMGLTSIDAVAGTSTGRLPTQRYFTVDFGNGVFFQPAGFNTMDERNFSGNRAVMFHVNHAEKLNGAIIGVRFPTPNPISPYAEGAVRTIPSPGLAVWLTKSVQNAPPWTLKVNGTSRSSGMRLLRRSS